MGPFLKRLKQKKTGCTAVIVAAGNASRMNGVDKIMAPLSGRPVISYTLEAFERCGRVQDVIVVTRSDLMVPIGDICRSFGFQKVRQIVAGGEDRTRSVLNGLKAAGPKAELIAIHDGARPFVTQKILEETIALAEKTSAAAPAVPVSDTIKTAENGIVTGTPDRSRLFAVQTPQVFDADLIRGALHFCCEQGAALTDDCSAVERLGKKVALSVGDVQNMKITTQFDLLMGEMIIQCRTAQ